MEGGGFGACLQHAHAARPTHVVHSTHTFAHVHAPPPTPKHNSQLPTNQPTQKKGAPMFELLGIDLFTTEGSVQHISRYVPSVR